MKNQTPIGRFLGNPDLDQVKNEGYRNFAKAVKTLDKSALRELNDFISKIYTDFGHYNLDWYLRKSGNLILGKRDPGRNYRGARILVVDVKNIKYRFVSSLLHIPGISLKTHSIKEYGLLTEYFLLNSSKIKRFASRSKGYVPVDYAYLKLNEISRAIGGLGPYDSVSDDESEIDNATGITPEKSWRQIAERRGGRDFRLKLLDAFGESCCVTGCTDVVVLEAAHIVPHAVELNMSINNGLLLRADIHTLFDLRLISISESGKIAISESVDSPEYQKLNGGSIQFGNGINKKVFAENIRKRKVLYKQKN